MRAPALSTTVSDIQLRRIFEVSAGAMGRDQTQRCARAERAQLICRVSPPQGILVILSRHDVFDMTERAAGQLRKPRLQFRTGGQQGGDHRLLMRRYWLTAIGAKTAMIARQHSMA